MPRVVLGYGRGGGHSTPGESPAQGHVPAAPMNAMCTPQVLASPCGVAWRGVAALLPRRASAMAAVGPRGSGRGEEQGGSFAFGVLDLGGAEGPRGHAAVGEGSRVPARWRSAGTALCLGD